MKQIPLTKNRIATIDDEDFEKVSKHSWCCEITKTGYARAFANINNKIVRLHRFVLGLTDSSVIVDHANGDSLDNRKSNLRICTRLENQRNQKTRTTPKSSKYKGVSLEKRSKKWHSYIEVNKKRITLGYFDTEVAAALAYNQAAEEYFGKFARPNKID